MGTPTPPRNLSAVARILAAIAEDLHGGDEEERAASVLLTAVRVAILSRRTLALAAQLQPWMAALEEELKQEEQKRHL